MIFIDLKRISIFVIIKNIVSTICIEFYYKFVRTVYLINFDVPVGIEYFLILEVVTVAKLSSYNDFVAKNVNTILRLKFKRDK